MIIPVIAQSLRPCRVSIRSFINQKHLTLYHGTGFILNCISGAGHFSPHKISGSIRAPLGIKVISELKSGIPEKSNNRSMVAAAFAAIGASLCCVGPLVLLTLGIGGAWISYLVALEPYRPVFIGITLIFLFLAFRKLYLMPRQCALGDTCAISATLHNQKIIFWLVSVLLLALLAFPYYGTLFFE
ncbi:MAG: hypothetical protein GXP22_11115 [Gammaproteobacteria bacterium]|nr:hypothetical protein [Gammaproteobacteria bacterium]